MRAALRARDILRPAVGWPVSVLLAAAFLAPLAWMAVASLRPDEEVFRGGPVEALRSGRLTLENYPDAWRAGGVGLGLLNSAVQVAGIVLVGLLVNAMAAYAFARLEFPGRDVLFAAVVVAIILPIQVLAVPLSGTVRTLWSPSGSWALTMAAYVVPFAAKAFNIYFLRQHFLGLPRELEEAAIVDGAGPWQVFWRVALPSIKPALATVVVLDVLVHWSDFIWPLIISTSGRTRTIQVSLAYLSDAHGTQWGDIMACAVIATLPVVLVFAVFQKQVVAAHLGAGIK
jgi:multiple sugar transport system permease protein/fructooligosaccharide transport system permease protein